MVCRQGRHDVGGVGFYQETIFGDDNNGFAAALVVVVSDGPGEGEVGATASQWPNEVGAPGVGMEENAPRWPAVTIQQFHHATPGAATVDRDGTFQFCRQ